MLLVAVSRWLVVTIAWFPMEGSVFIDFSQSARLKTILSDRKDSWTTKSVLGGDRFYFRNPFSLMSVEDRIEKDAHLNGYSVIIEYRTLLPPYRRVRSINDSEPSFQ